MVVDAQTAPFIGRDLARLAAAEGLLRLFAQRRGELTQNYTLLLQQGGEEALHDLRVSLRRLHSLLHNYRTAFQANTPLQQALHQLQQQTNATRDLEVFVAQLTTSFPEQSQLIATLQRELHGHYQQLHRGLPAQWETLRPLLEHPPEISLGNDERNTLGSLTSHIGRQQLKRMKKRFRALHRHWDEALLHRLRIRGKRLRYLLEPFAGEAGVAKALRTLKHLQEELGDYHDRQLLLQRLSAWPAGDEGGSVIPALIEALQMQRKQLKKQVKKYRKPSTQQRFLKPLRHALQQLKKN